MNCREAETHLFADRSADPASAPAAAALEVHLAQCPACRRLQSRLRSALDEWRTEAAATPTPDVEREWHAVRRRIRGAETAAAPLRRFWPWLSVPLGLGAAAALTILVWQRPPSRAEARADFVEVPGGKASTMVFVDEKSGWLIVQASDSPGTSD